MNHNQSDCATSPNICFGHDAGCERYTRNSALVLNIGYKNANFFYDINVAYNETRCAICTPLTGEVGKRNIVNQFVITMQRAYI
ncbi:hypothetical protein EZJ58_0446 [Sodalis ligni]|uniref:Uncharacterized protein n=1 Tax=Sodalis ligni TaxID=2697027 RepID=A0A4R1N797_9GAMM|nr:hypothetical protein EZJ58_0446 [Sodalis ligni]